MRMVSSGSHAAHAEILRIIEVALLKEANSHLLLRINCSGERGT